MSRGVFGHVWGALGAYALVCTPVCGPFDVMQRSSVSFKCAGLTCKSSAFGVFMLWDLLLVILIQLLFIWNINGG